MRPPAAAYLAHSRALILAAHRDETPTETADRYRRIADEYRRRARVMFHEDMSDTALLGIAAAAEAAADMLDQQDLDAAVAGLAPECPDCGAELTEDGEIEAELCRVCQRELFESEKEGF